MVWGNNGHLRSLTPVDNGGLLCVGVGLVLLTLTAKPTQNLTIHISDLECDLEGFCVEEMAFIWQEILYFHKSKPSHEIP